MKVFIAYVLVCALALAFLVHFIFIARYGRISIGEPNPFILWTEIAGLVVVLVFGVAGVIGEARKG